MLDAFSRLQPVFTQWQFIVKEWQGDNEKGWEKEEGGGVFGFRVGKGSALGIVPESPSLYKQPLVSASPLRQSLHLPFWCLLHAASSHFAGRKYGQIDASCLLLFWQFHLSPCPSDPPDTHTHTSPNPAISKVNTPLNAGLTHFHCGWFCFQFSHHLSHPTTSEEKRKLLSRKQKTKVQTGHAKRQRLFFYVA